MKVLDLPKMYTVIKKKGLQDFVGIMFKCKVVCLVQARQRKDGIVRSWYFLLFLWFCFFWRGERGKKKSPKLYVCVKLYESET